MHSTPYEAVIGLEVHAQLLTTSKLFGPDSAAFGAEPNEHVDVVSLGHPGTLPVLNGQAVTFAVKMGLATGSRITSPSIFARKHYFYPDLPKGYQISQYDTPICAGGHVDLILDDGTPKRVGLTRIHLEEDAGKSLHDQSPTSTLLDYNRCGVPLIEIVSEPDIRSGREAALYVQKIRQIVRYLGICDGNMEEGSLRCDANVSIRPRGETSLGTKTEIKNMNSFRHVERAIEHEIARQIAVVESGGRIVQETRLWDANRGETRPMRSKEEAHDYRYFPDPDLVPIVVTEAMRKELRAALPELAEARRSRYESELGLPAYDAALLTEERGVSDYFEETLRLLGDERQAKAVSNFVMTSVLRVLNEGTFSIEHFPVEPGRLAALVRLRLDERISSTGAQELFESMLTEPDAPEEIAERRKLLQVSDEGSLVPLVEAVVAEHPKEAERFRSGQQQLIGFFVGQVMRRFDGSPDPKLVRTLLLERLEG